MAFQHLLEFRQVIQPTRYKRSWITNTFIILLLPHVYAILGTFRDTILILQDTILILQEGPPDVYTCNRNTRKKHSVLLCC